MTDQKPGELAFDSQKKARNYKNPLTGSVFMAALGTVVVISADYVDSGHALGVIHGVQHVVARACEVMS